MDALARVMSSPVFTPLQVQLLDLLESGSPDERTVARGMSVDVGELRQIVGKLARHLNLPAQSTPAAELSQLGRHAAQFAVLRKQAGESARKGLNGTGAAPQSLAQWQAKLAEVAAAIAKGVLIAVDPYKIRPMYGQPRDYFPEEEQGSLEASFGLMGQVQDIIIRKSRSPRGSSGAASVFEDGQRIWRIADTEYEICDGERRWRGSMSKKLIEIRAKLIEIDDEGAYLVAAVSNFNRVGHTALEQARNIKRLMEGPTPFPIEAIAAMQGISKVTAEKLLNTLNLPPDIQEMMDPMVQRERGAEVLGKMPAYELGRLATNSVLHEHVRHLAGRYVNREIKMPELRAEVDRVLLRSGAERGSIPERNQPARRFRLAENKISLAIDLLRDAKGRLEDLREERALPAASERVVRDINDIADIATKILTIVSGQREKSN